jgi:hypothetical protein
MHRRAIRLTWVSDTDELMRELNGGSSWRPDGQEQEWGLDDVTGQHAAASQNSFM